MESSNKSRGCTLPNLPPEIMTEILLYLPVNSLLKFRSVCKSWLSLISSSKFIKTHLNYSTKSNNYSIIYDTHDSPITYYSCSLSSMLCNTAMDNYKVLHIPFCQSDDHLWFVGSCNGLLCVSIDPDLVLYNPAIRNFKTLPDSGTDVETTDLVSYGFCYDELNDDFKVVEISKLCDQTTSMHHIEVKVYSLRNNSWRGTQNNCDGFDIIGDAINIGGILHWFSYEDDRGYQIFAVNTVTYIYDTLAPPRKHHRRACQAGWSLRELNGCLGVFYNYNNIRLDVWKMKEYGVEESWTKLFSIDYLDNPQSSFFPLLVLKNGDIFLHCGTYMVVCHSIDKSFTAHEVHNIEDMGSVVAPPYTESLVAPSLFGEQ